MKLVLVTVFMFFSINGFALDIPAPGGSKSGGEIKALEDNRLKAEAEAKAKVANDAKLKAEADARSKLEAEAKAKAANEAKLKAEADARSKLEAEAKVKAANEAKLKAEAEARSKLEAEAKARAANEAKLKAEADARSKLEAETKAKAANEAKLKAEADSRSKLEAEAKTKAANEAKLKAETDARIRKQADSKGRVEAESKSSIPDDRAKVESELRLATEARIKAEMDAKATADLRAKAEADMKFAAELKAKAEAENKSLSNRNNVNQPTSDVIKAQRIYDGIWQLSMLCGPNIHNNRPSYNFKKEFKIIDNGFEDQVTNKSQLGTATEIWTGRLSKNNMDILVRGKRDTGDSWEIRFSGLATSIAKFELKGGLYNSKQEKVRDCEISLIRM